VGAVALVVPYRTIHSACSLRTDNLPHVVSKIPHIPERFREQFAGENIAPFRENQIEPAGKTGDDPFVLAHRLVDETALENILCCLDARAPETIYRRFPFF
jgi:hypothetical protein